MTPRQIDLVQASFKSVLLIADTTAEVFYARLFELDPALKPLFKTDMKEQGRKLMYMIGAAVAWLKKFDNVVPALEALAQRHAGYGVAPQHYDSVGAALIWALHLGLEDAFTGEVEAAWVAAYTQLAGVMKHAAYGKAYA